MQAAKQRAREIAMERRRYPERFAPPPPEDPALIASERVLGDDSLQSGDIASTNTGLFVFRGSNADQPRTNEAAAAAITPLGDSSWTQSRHRLFVELAVPAFPPAAY